jgi:hypothetical protein
VNGHSSKLHFFMFERSQGKHNSLDCHKCFWDIRIKILLTLKIMDFENVILIKVVHIYVIEGMNA